MVTFWDRYDAWLEDCRAEYEARFGPLAAGDIVEFAESGDAYPHGAGGIGHVRGAVTPWANSPHYVN